MGKLVRDKIPEIIEAGGATPLTRILETEEYLACLEAKLDEVTVSCVNKVGVELNTASAPLLTRVSGIGASLAKRIVEWRNEHGAFKSRADLKKVTGLGPKAFEQSAGFLRIRGAANPLDASAVHPERYALVIATYMALDGMGTACNLTGDGAIALIVDRLRSRSA